MKKERSRKKEEVEIGDKGRCLSSLDDSDDQEKETDQCKWILPEINRAIQNDVPSPPLINYRAPLSNLGSGRVSCDELQQWHEESGLGAAR